MNALDLILDILSWISLLGGSFFCLTGVMGMLRLPDFFTRTHGAGVIDGLGAGLILFGLILQAPTVLIAVKMLIILVFLMITGPTAVHSLARAALHGGLKLLPDGDDAAPAKEEEAAP